MYIQNSLTGAKIFGSDAIKSHFDILKNQLKRNKCEHWQVVPDDLSALEIDFDIYSKQEKFQFTIGEIEEITNKIIRELIKHIKFEGLILPSLYVVIKLRPKVDNLLAWSGKHNAFKDGWHLTIPEVLLTKNERKYLINWIAENILPSHLTNKSLTKYEDVVDFASSWVPHCFIGSAKRDKQYYYKPLYYEFICDNPEKGIQSANIPEYINEILEFSINKFGFEKFTEKKRYEFKEDFINAVDTYVKKIELEKDEKQSLNNKYKPDEDHQNAIKFTHKDDFIMLILKSFDYLDNDYSDDSKKWFTILAIIKNITKFYELDETEMLDMLDKFSQRSDKYVSYDDVYRNYEAVKPFGYETLLFHYVNVKKIWAEYFKIIPNKKVKWDTFNHKTELLEKSENTGLVMQEVLDWMKTCIYEVQGAENSYYIKTKAFNQFAKVDYYYLKKTDYTHLCAGLMKNINWRKKAKQEKQEKQEIKDNDDVKSEVIYDVLDGCYKLANDKNTQNNNQQNNQNNNQITQLNQNILIPPYSESMPVQPDISTEVNQIAQLNIDIRPTSDGKTLDKKIIKDKEFEIKKLNKEIERKTKLYTTEVEKYNKRKSKYESSYIKEYESKRKKEETAALRKKQKDESAEQRKLEKKQALGEKQAHKLQTENENKELSTLEDVFKYATKNNMLKVYDDVHFYPYYKFLPEDHNLLNLFPGFPLINYVPKKRINFTDSYLYKHIKEQLCCGNEGLFKFVMSYIAHMIQKPAECPRSALLFKTQQGNGKDLLLTFIRFLVGTGNVAGFDNPDQFFSNFNSRCDGKICICLNEVQSKGTDSNSDMLKSFVTREIAPIEPKGKEIYDSLAFSRYIFFTNNDRALYIPHDDRRFTLIDSKNDFANNAKYFMAIKNEIYDVDFQKYALDYFGSYDITDYNPGVIYETEYHLDQKIKCLNSSYRFLYSKTFDENDDTDNTEEEEERWSNSVKYEDKVIVSKRDLYNSYKIWCDSNNERCMPANTFISSIEQLGLSLKKYKINVDDDRKIGYNLSKVIMSDLFTSYLKLKRNDT